MKVKKIIPLILIIVVLSLAFGFTQLNASDVTAVNEEPTPIPESIVQLVDKTEMERHTECVESNRETDGLYREIDFILTTSKIHGYYDEGDKLKVFVTTYYALLKVDENIVTDRSGGIVPGAITYERDENGNYILEEYEEAKDGELNASSIKGFCTMPVSGDTIEGLAETIIKNTSADQQTLVKLHWEQLKSYVIEHGMIDFLYKQHESASPIPFV